MEGVGEAEVLNFLEYVILGNTVADYTVAFGVLVGALLVFKVFREVILKKLARLSETTATNLDNTLVEIIRTMRPPFYVFLSAYLAVLFLDIDPVIFRIITYALLIWVGYQAAVALSVFVDHVVKKRASRENEPHSQAALYLLGTLVKGVVWVAVILFVLSNMGVNITSFIATLGIGGVAVALALQNILNDLFSSFALYFDKPFEVGDFVVVGSHLGVVEKIGIKTTRLRALQGEEIVISNQELTTARIQNFKKLRERRVVFTFGVTYETPNDALEKIPEKVGEIIENVEHARFDRAHFYRFDESALTFEVVYYLLSSEYHDYMNAQQAINLAIKDVLEKEGIAFAYPTRTVHMHGGST